MKIVFIGAGMASLVASERLARCGVDVSVYEKNDYDDLSYDWHDDINPDAFKAYGLPYPEDGTYFVKKNWTFIPPGEGIEVQLNLAENELDWSTERRLLAQQYVDRAKDVVDFHFASEVESLIIKDEVVKGVIVNGKEIFADLVVDNSGAMSKFRRSLPDGMKITKMPKKDEIFIAYRAFHKKREGVADPESSNRAYLKHLGQKGISWSILDPSDSVNVLIGRIGEMSQSEFETAYNALKVSNPQISDEIVRGGIRCIIPVRYPLLRMTGDGYVAIGDSAFMTIPMIGSGIENSMKAACMLADIIIKNRCTDKQSLWQYQVEYFKNRGANHIGVDIMKRWLLNASSKDLDWLFENGIVNDKDMACGATGKLVSLTFNDMLGKLRKGWRRLPLLIKMSVMLSKTKRAAKLGMNIPATYDERKIDRWSKKISRLVYGEKSE